MPMQGALWLRQFDSNVVRLQFWEHSPRLYYEFDRYVIKLSWMSDALWCVSDKKTVISLNYRAEWCQATVSTRWLQCHLTTCRYGALRTRPEPKPPKCRKNSMSSQAPCNVSRICLHNPDVFKLLAWRAPHLRHTTKTWLDYLLKHDAPWDVMHKTVSWPKHHWTTRIRGLW